MSKTSLKPLGLPASSDAVDDYAKERGVPVLASVSSLPTQPPQVESAAPKMAPITKMAIEVPHYLPAQLRRMALEQDCTIRFLVLDALHNAGCSIAPEDRVKDGRRQGQIVESANK